MGMQVQMVSQDGKLYSGMTIASINSDNTKTEKEKSKLIELFNKANTTPDNVLDKNEIDAYNEECRKKANRRKNLIRLVGTAIVAGVAFYFLRKGFNKLTEVPEGFNIPQNQTTQVLQKSELPLLSEAGVHERILNGEFGALQFKSTQEVGKIYQDFAKTQGLHFEDCGGSFMVKDTAGNMVREAHQGFFDGLWYDHHQVFNPNNKITNRFVLNHEGKLQSTVEYFYDKAGELIKSVGYGGKAGKDIMVFGGDGSRSQFTLAEYIKKFGDMPKYYKEICS